jgi:RING-type zinc-finger
MGATGGTSVQQANQLLGFTFQDDD